VHTERLPNDRSPRSRAIQFLRALGRLTLASLGMLLLGLHVACGQVPSEAKPSSGGRDKNSNSTSSSSIPGGSLEAHEKAGGHLLSRHVGKSAEQLRQRLEKDSRISASSSFTDKKTAETAVSATIGANQKKIASWLKGDEDRLVITYRSSTPVGISIGRQSSRTRDATGVRLVLVRNPKFPGGWHILTGYPEA
jgi:filamentous hemagglutinin